MFILSYFDIAPGKGYLFKFLPVIERGGRPSFAKSRTPSDGSPSTP